MWGFAALTQLYQQFDFKNTSVLSKQNYNYYYFWQWNRQREHGNSPFPLNVIEWGTMSQTAATDDSACPPLTKAVSMTIITRLLFTLLTQTELFPSGFKESSTCKEDSTGLSRNHPAFDLALACRRPKLIFNLDSFTSLWISSNCLWKQMWIQFSVE